MDSRSVKPCVPNTLEFSERINQVVDEEQLMLIIQKVVFVFS